MGLFAEKGPYERMKYRRCGRSGLLLPEVSLGLWHNFGHVDILDSMKAILCTAFDQGITHLDLANNYGPPPGSAEENFGRILRQELGSHRDELIISTKAGYHMWEGPYGEWGSRKHMIASLDQSLKRMGLDYVDIFYHHRPDPDTPLEETMLALDQVVRQGKALYVGISNYNAAQSEAACRILTELKTPFVINQSRYSLLDRKAETDGLKDKLEELGLGLIVFSPLAQGLLTDRYLNGIPADSRAGSHKTPFLPEERITPELLKALETLRDIARERGQTLAQMALSWVLRDDAVTSVLVGASKVSQLLDCAQAVENTTFSVEELYRIEKALVY